MSEDYHRPPPLRRGDTIQVIAPSSPFHIEHFECGLRRLQKHFRLLHDEDISRKGIDGQQRGAYLAGSDRRRAQELLSALRNPEVRLILCARGGYGAARVLPLIPEGAFRESNAWLAGFSDVTALHLRAQREAIESLHSPMAAWLGRVEEQLFEEWTDQILCPPETFSIRPIAPVEGGVEGRLAGGNLAVISSMLGTPEAPCFRDRILFLEDVAEPPYKLDRMLFQMTQSEVLFGVRAVVLGQFTRCGEAPEALVSRLLAPLNIPIYAGLPVGHDEENHVLRLGAKVRLERNRLRYLP